MRTHDFVTASIGHCKNSASLSDADLPNVDTFCCTVSFLSSPEDMLIDFIEREIQGEKH